MNNPNRLKNILGGLGMIVGGVFLALLVVTYWLPGELSSIRGLTASPGSPEAFDEAFGFKPSDLWFFVIGVAIALIGGGIALIQGKKR